MSKKKTPKKTTAAPRTPADFAARVLDKHLSDNQLYWEVLDQLSGDDFVELENAVMANQPSREQDDRALATQEVCFMLGLEIGRRVGGTR